MAERKIVGICASATSRWRSRPITRWKDDPSASRHRQDNHRPRRDPCHRRAIRHVLGLPRPRLRIQGLRLVRHSAEDGIAAINGYLPSQRIDSKSGPWRSEGVSGIPLRRQPRRSAVPRARRSRGDGAGSMPRHSRGPSSLRVMFGTDDPLEPAASNGLQPWCVIALQSRSDIHGNHGLMNVRARARLRHSSPFTRREVPPCLLRPWPQHSPLPRGDDRRLPPHRRALPEATRCRPSCATAPPTDSCGPRRRWWRERPRERDRARGTRGYLGPHRFEGWWRSTPGAGGGDPREHQPGVQGGAAPRAAAVGSAAASPRAPARATGMLAQVRGDCPDPQEAVVLEDDWTIAPALARARGPGDAGEAAVRRPHQHPVHVGHHGRPGATLTHHNIPNNAYFSATPRAIPSRIACAFPCPSITASEW
jgi:hypothetical protein